MKPMKCKVCGKGFSPADDSPEARGAALARLNKHRRKEHPTAARQPSEKKLRKESAAWREQSEAFGLTAPKFCPHCGKRL